MNSKAEHHIVVAVTGASGAAYGLRLIQRLHAAGLYLHLLFSDAARIVLKQECDFILPENPDDATAYLTSNLQLTGSAGFRVYALKDWFSPVASGSSAIRQMVVAPCSMGTLARIAQGISDNLIERAADVVLKEKGQLLLMPRETPLSAIHLQHMLTLARLGVEIIPAMPGFYHRPTSIEELQDFMVDRLLDRLHVENVKAQRWGMST